MDLSAGWFEALIRILCRDAGCTAVSSDGRIVHSEEIDLGVHRGIHSIELPRLCHGVWKKPRKHVQTEEVQVLLKLNGCQVNVKSTFAEAGAVRPHSKRSL